MEMNLLAVFAVKFNGLKNTQACKNQRNNDFHEVFFEKFGVAGKQTE